MWLLLPFICHLFSPIYLTPFRPLFVCLLPVSLLPYLTPHLSPILPLPPPFYFLTSPFSVRLQAVRRERA